MARVRGKNHYQLKIIALTCNKPCREKPQLPLEPDLKTDAITVLRLLLLLGAAVAAAEPPMPKKQQRKIKCEKNQM